MSHKVEPSLKSQTKNRELYNYYSTMENIVGRVVGINYDLEVEDLIERDWFIFISRKEKTFDHNKVKFINKSIGLKERIIIRMISFDEESRTSIFIGTDARIDQDGSLIFRGFFSAKKFDDNITETEYRKDNCFSIIKAYETYSTSNVICKIRFLI